MIFYEIVAIAIMIRWPSDSSCVIESWYRVCRRRMRACLSVALARFCFGLTVETVDVDVAIIDTQVTRSA